MKLSPKLFSVSALILFVILTGLVTMRRSAKGSNDFDTFYQSGKAVTQGQGIYYTGEYYETAADIGPFLYPPPAACMFSLLAFLPIKPASFIWNLLNIFFFAAALKFTWKILGGWVWTNDRFLTEIRKPQSVLIGVLALVFFLDNLSMAQVNILLYFLCISALLLFKKKHLYAAGAVFSLAIWLKLTPALFAVYFLFKKQGKVLTGILVGSLLLAVILPVGVFGMNKTRLYYRQWTGRMIKPGIISLISKFQKYEPHPGKKSPEELQLVRLSDMLVEKNQSLEAGLTRLFLKDRNSLAMSTSFPIYAAQRYTKLPVLFGGLSRPALSSAIRVLMVSMMLGLIYVWSRSKDFFLESMRTSFELSLVFISMILFSPFARSHQFLSLLFPLLTYFIFSDSILKISKSFPKIIWISGALFLLQGLPYGKAAALGTWSALILWGAYFVIGYKLARRISVSDPQ